MVGNASSTPWRIGTLNFNVINGGLCWTFLLTGMKAIAKAKLIYVIEAARNCVLSFELL